MLKKIMTVLTSLVFVVGCSTFGPTVDLDTNEKKLAAAEIAVDEMNELAIRSFHRIPEDKRDEVWDLLRTAKEALDFARIAIDPANGLDFTTSISKVSSIIRLLRPILEAIEAEEVSYERNSNSLAYS